MPTGIGERRITDGEFQRSTMACVSDGRTWGSSQSKGKYVLCRYLLPPSLPAGARGELQKQNCQNLQLQPLDSAVTGISQVSELGRAALPFSRHIYTRCWLQHHGRKGSKEAR